MTTTAAARRPARDDRRRDAANRRGACRSGSRLTRLARARRASRRAGPVAFRAALSRDRIASTSSPSASADRRRAACCAPTTIRWRLRAATARRARRRFRCSPSRRSSTGRSTHLQACATAVDVPLLRKDFIVSEYQLLEARAAGADAVLLIVGGASPGRARTAARRRPATSASMCWSRCTPRRADGRASTPAPTSSASTTAISARSTVDVDASEELIARIPTGVTAVSESGLKTPADITRFTALGYRAFLIGERFMTTDDPGAALREPA